MTGGRTAHPLLISLANISMEFRNKASNRAFLLLALLPIPKYIHKKSKVRGMLEAQLYHQSLNIVLAPLKAAAQFGIMLSDPLGNLRWCFTPLASFIVNTPEAEVLSLPHRFRLEPVGTDQIPIGNFQVGYLPNKQRIPSFLSDRIPIGSAGTESDHIPTGSDRFQADPIGSAHISK